MLLLSLWLFVKLLSKREDWVGNGFFFLATLFSSFAVLMLPLSMSNRHLSEGWQDLATLGAICLLFGPAFLYAGYGFWDTSSEAKGDEITGWVVRFGEERFYRGPASRINGFWNRYFGLDRFVSGFRMFESVAGEGDQPRLHYKIVVIATVATDPEGFSGLAERVFHNAKEKFEGICETGLSKAGIVNVAADWLKECEQYPVVRVQLQKLNYSSAPENLLPLVKAHMTA